MTRETKISLLVGLAFIIVIGILLSDHFRSTQELPHAMLPEIASSVHQATDGPESSNPAITWVPPGETQPRQAVPTRDELTPPQSPVIPSRTYGSPSAGSQAPTGAESGPENQKPASPDNPLNSVAQQHGESLVPANEDGSSHDTTDTDAPPSQPQQNQSPSASTPRQYVAQDGDSVSRMASKFLGENTRANRQAIIDANPSLRDNPDRVIVGKTYAIPTPADAGSEVESTPTEQSPTRTTATGAYYYTVREGDSLWQIANDQLDDPSAVAAIKDLNAGLLKGEQHDVVVPGMRLRLPAKPVADSTTN